MKTKLFLIATLLISTITFSQTSKKGYDYYKASSEAKMNKGELIDAMAKDAKYSVKKYGEIGNHPNRAKSSKQELDLHLRKRPGSSQGDSIPGIGITTEQGKLKGQDHNASRSNTSSSKIP